MSFDVNNWMRELINRLRDAFGARLLAVGLQGSFGRGEARENSDIDAVVILDAVSAADVDAYKKILARMPAGTHSACGFFGGKEALKNWSRAELFQFTHDTKTLYGSFDGILPTPTRRDALDAARTGAGTLYHALIHTWLHGDLTPAFLKELYKAAFFMLQAAHFVKTGRYLPGKKALGQELTDPAEREILRVLAGQKPLDDTLAAAEKLLACCQKVLSIS